MLHGGLVYFFHTFSLCFVQWHRVILDEGEFLNFYSLVHFMYLLFQSTKYQEQAHK